MYNELGPAQKAYQRVMKRQLEQRGLRVEVQKSVDIVYRGLAVQDAFRVDLRVGLLINFGAETWGRTVKRIANDAPDLKPLTGRRRVFCALLRFQRDNATYRVSIRPRGQLQRQRPSVTGVQASISRWFVCGPHVAGKARVFVGVDREDRNPIQNLLPGPVLRAARFQTRGPRRL